jgi:hypothetical protein
MKYILLLLVISGCSTVSEYNRGCRDGVMGVQPRSADAIAEYCNALEQMHDPKSALKGNK